MPLVPVDLYQVVQELTELVMISERLQWLDNEETLPHQENTRCYVSRMLALLPVRLELADCDVTVRSELRRLKDHLEWLVQTFPSDVENAHSDIRLGDSDRHILRGIRNQLWVYWSRTNRKGDTDDAASDEGFYPAREIAERYGIPPQHGARFQKHLDRWRRQNLNSTDWREVHNPARNTPRFLYRAAAMAKLARKYQQHPATLG